MKQPFLTLVILFFFGFHASGNIQNGVIHIKKHDLAGAIELTDAWKYHNGDNMQWAQPDFNDAAWDTLRPHIDLDKIKESQFAGKGWFRLHIILDSSIDEPLGLVVLFQSGSSEIYLDGKKILSYKDPDNYDSAYNPAGTPSVIHLTGGKEHLLAIRYKNLTAWSNYEKLGITRGGFNIELKNLDWAIENNLENAVALSAILMFLFGLFTCIAALHFILYLYNREEKSNYSYARYALLMALLWLFSFISVRSTNPYTFAVFSFAFTIIIKGILLATLRLLYSLFFGKKSRFFWIVFATALISILIDKLHFSWRNYVDALFYVLITIDTVRIIIKAFRQKKEGSTLVGSAALFLCLYVATLIVTYFITSGIELNTGSNWGIVLMLGLIFCIISIPLAMSFYLARRFARLNRDLKKKLLEVEELSAKNLLAEQEKQKMLENRKEELEKQVLQRTAEVTMQKEQILQKSEELGKSLEELKSAHSQLVQQEKMASLGQLTAGIAHEINNPINFVSNSIPSLKRDIHDLMEVYRRYDEMHHATGSMEEKLKSIEILKKQMDIPYAMDEINSLLQGIQDGASRTAEIVKSLRNFSRLDENDIKKADINEGLTSTLTILHSQMQEGIQLETELGALPRIDCYPGQLNQVFMNIITNAIQAIEGKGTISIKTWQEGPEVKISIKDSGQGMSEEVKKKIFDPFYTTKDVGKGTGLGLSISYNIIEKHKGRIEVSSQPGKGTEFIITLPVEME